MGYNSVADIVGLSSFFSRCSLPNRKIRRNSEKIDLTAVQGHPRSSILMSI